MAPAATETLDTTTGEVTEPELPGMPERPDPLWESDPALATLPIREVNVSLSGSIDLVASEPGHRVLAEALRHGASVYLQAEGRVAKRGIGDKGGLAVVKLSQIVRADEAGVLELQEELTRINLEYIALARAAAAVGYDVAGYLPAEPEPDDDRKEARHIRSVRFGLDSLRMRARRVLASVEG